MPASVRIQAVIGSLLALGAAVSYPLLHQWWQAQQADVLWLSAEQPCHFGPQACFASDGSRTLSVSASSAQLTAKEPFDIVVTLDNVPTEQLWLQLEGINMYMGVSRYRLQPLGDNRYGMSVRLPTCAVERMNWRASILAQTTEQTVGYQFEFAADTNS